MKQILIKNWLVISIVILSLFLRLYHISDYMEFLGDQGRDVVISRNFIKTGRPFFIGPQTSIGNMYLGPYYYYLIVVPGLILFGLNPIGPAILVALLGGFTTYLIFKFSSNWFNKYTGIVASIFYAISPVAIKYSNFSWNPNIMPLFSLLFIHYLLTSQYILASIAFIICLNSHYLALLLLPVAGIIWLYNFRQSNKDQKSLIKNTIIAIVVFLISFTPQIMFDIKHKGQNIGALFTFFSQRESTVNLKPYKAIPYMAPIFNQVTTRLIAGKNENFGIIVSVLFAFLIVFIISREFKSKKRNLNFIVVLLWIIIGIGGLALYKQHIYDHYFGFLFPAFFILFAYCLSRLPKILSLPIILVIIYFSALENPFRWPAPRQLYITQQISSSILQESNGQPFNFALLAKMNYDPGYRYFLTSQNDSQLKLLNDQITDQLFVVCEPFQIDCNPINNPFWDVAAFGWAKIDKQWEIGGNQIFKLSHNLQ